MKRMKKLVSLVLATIMVLAMAIPTAAAPGDESTPQTGTITIKSPVEGHTYTIYQILKLESYNATVGTYAYKVVNNSWKDFLDSYKITVDGNEKKVFHIDGNNYVTINADVEEQMKMAEYIAPFAKDALKHATTHSNEISAANSQEYKGGELKFTGLELGYYLVDSNLGTLCGLNTTNPVAEIKEKNGVPELKKEVQEDSKSGDTNGGWGDFADADRGQVVNFKVTITAKSGAQKYVLYDKMESGLKFDEDSVVITRKKANGTEQTVDKTSDYNVFAGDSLNATEKADWTFKVVFEDSFCDSLEAEETITVQYSAMVKEEAMAVTNGKNTAQLKYGDNSQFATQPSAVTVRTWEIPIFKYSKDGENKKGLAGATFTLYRDKEGEQPIQLISVSSGTANGYLLWRVATPEEIALPNKTVTEITTDAKGHFVLRGLDSGTYYLREIAAPEGYNKLPDALEIKINTVYNETEKMYESQVIYDNGAVEEVEVLNQSGSLLPITGGIGTTIFYVVGGILVAAAVVLLVTRKRMSIEK